MNNEENRLLDKILLELQDNNALLRTQVAETLANNQLLTDLVAGQMSQTELLQDIVDNQSRFSARAIQFFQENTMALVTLAPGNVAQFGIVLLFNGTPASASNGNVPASYTMAPTLAFDDSLVTVAPATTDASGGTVPLAQQFTATDGTGDTATSTIGTFTFVDPLGNTITTPITWAASTTPPVDGFSGGAVQLL